MCRGRECVENLPCFQLCCELQTVLKNKIYFLEKVTVAIVGFSRVNFVESLPLCVPELRRATFFFNEYYDCHLSQSYKSHASRHGLLTRNQK